MKNRMLIFLGLILYSNFLFSQTGHKSYAYNYLAEVGKQLQETRNEMNSTSNKLSKIKRTKSLNGVIKSGKSNKEKKKRVRFVKDSLENRLDTLKTNYFDLKKELDKCRKNRDYVKTKNKEYEDKKLEEWKENYAKSKQERLAPYKSEIKILDDIYKLSLQYCDSIDYVTKQVFEGGKYEGNHKLVNKEYNRYLNKIEIYVENYNGFSNQLNLPDKILKEVRLKKKLNYKLDFYCLRE